MDGKATLTMVASRKARKAPKQATRSTRDAGTRPRRAAATDHLLEAASVPRGVTLAFRCLRWQAFLDLRSGVEGDRGEPAETR